MDKKNLGEKRSQELIRVISEVSTTSIKEQTKNSLKFFIGTVQSINSRGVLANVKMPLSTKQEYELIDIQATVKTIEKISVGDSVLVVYPVSLNNCYIIAKISENFIPSITGGGGGGITELPIDTFMPSDPSDERVLSTKWIADNIYVKTFIDDLLKDKLDKIPAVAEDSVYGIGENGSQIIIPVSDLVGPILEIRIDDIPVLNVDGVVDIPMADYVGGLFESATYDFETSTITFFKQDGTPQELEIKSPSGAKEFELNDLTKELTLTLENDTIYTIDLSTIIPEVKIDNVSIIKNEENELTVNSAILPTIRVWG